MDQKILLLLGAGANIGGATVQKFKAEGYKVAAVARNPIDSVKSSSDLVLAADFSDPSCIAGLFQKVEQSLGIPTVVIYNAYSWTRPTDPSSMINNTVSGLTNDFAVNTISVFAAIQEAVSRWLVTKLVRPTFFFTGNRGNTAICPPAFALALTKASTWYILQTAIASYKDQGLRFYFVDERTPEGKGMMYISGAAHADFFFDLVEKEDQGPPLATFVREKGYVAFAGDEGASLPVYALEELADWEYGKPE